MEISRQQAESTLLKIFGIEHFYDEQWKAINAILQGKRILMIARTGFGKSLCYQYPAVLFDGVTVVFSPLIALMRDQVKSLSTLHISARCINCEESLDDNKKSIEDAIDGKVKILYIAPERQENDIWQEAVRHIKLSMVVVDEAHTISQWGHDFRPAFRRIKNLVRNYLPADMPVLATTATATERVQKDIEEQLGSSLTTIRCNLIRKNFRLFVIETSSEDEKMLWLKHNLNKLDGTGIIYAGTRVQTCIYARWLSREKINAIDYNAGLDAITRKEIEQGFMENKWKCLVSTNALGMGIDKPDIRFVIHLQIPASPIHYYQEIGRAGRDGKPTVVILFFNSNKNEDGIMEDYLLPKSFIDNARPSENKYKAFIDAVKNEQLGEKGLMMRTNLKQSAIRVIKEDLIEQGIIKEVLLRTGKKYEYQYNAPNLDLTKYEMLKEAKCADLQQMVNYIYTKEPRMKFLCNYLGDNDAADYANTCDNTGLKKMFVNANKEDLEDIKEFNESFFPELPLVNYTKMIAGVAASYYGVSSVGRIIHRCKYENGGDFPQSLVSQSLRAYYHAFKNFKFDMILYVPATISGDLVKHFAHTMGGILKIRVSDGLIKTRVTQPQKIYQQHYGKSANIKGAFDYKLSDEIRGKVILLIDDVYDSGATIKEISKRLSELGVAGICILVIAKTVGGDNI